MGMNEEMREKVLNVFTLLLGDAKVNRTITLNKYIHQILSLETKTHRIAVIPRGESPLLKLCKDIFEFACHGDYSNGNDAFGSDEGRYLAGKRLDELEAQLKSYSCNGDPKV